MKSNIGTFTRQFLLFVIMLAGVCLPSAHARLQPATTAPPPVAQPEAPAAAAISTPPALVLDAGIQPAHFTGRVYILLSQGDGAPVRRMNDWFRAPLLFSKDVKDLAPGALLALDDSWLATPTPWKDVPAGEYTIQAVARRSLDTPTPGTGPDDVLSDPVKVALPPVTGGSPTAGVMRLASLAEQRPFPETDRIKVVEIVSPSMSKFHGREYKVRAGVLLPTSYKDDGSISYPVIYSVTGFGGDHKAIRGAARMVPPEAADKVIIVVPDPLCYRGHSVFADSATNGPWGEMLVHELAPEIEKRFHGAGAAQRYATGVSSGGWSSLWLQVTYPDDFAGCWSHCPDPVDFRDFQRINIYEPGTSMYKDPAGERRPLARQGDKVMLWYDDFCKREWVLGPGGQIHSFEAVFSPRGADGAPRLLFDRQTGAIDTDVAKTWEKYDIRLVLERNWSTLGPKLAGKLHIYAGGVDTFYLEGAVKLLKESLANLKSDAVVEIIEGMPHTLHREGNAAMFQTILERQQQLAR